MFLYLTSALLIQHIGPKRKLFGDSLLYLQFLNCYAATTNKPETGKVDDISKAQNCRRGGLFETPVGCKI